MKKVLKARKGGFTLVELLIVVMIIGVLASMMMMSSGAATDTAEAAKLIADATLTATAAAMYFADYGEWPADADAGPSLDLYINRNMFDDPGTGDDHPYDLLVTSRDVAGIRLTLIGIEPRDGGTIRTGVQTKLAQKAVDSGIYQNDGTPYKTGDEVYVGLSKSLITTP